MSKISVDGGEEPEEDQREKGSRVERNPRVSRECVANKIRTECNLMRKAERHRNVDVEMNPVPRLICKEGACGSNGDDGNKDKESDRNRGANAPLLAHGEVNDPVKNLTRSCNAIAGDKGGGRSERVHHKQPDGGEAGETVKARRLIAPNNLLNPRRA